MKMSRSAPSKKGGSGKSGPAMLGEFGAPKKTRSAADHQVTQSNWRHKSKEDPQEAAMRTFYASLGAAGY